MKTSIQEILNFEPQGQKIEVYGWVRAFRNEQFVALNDGSSLQNLQIVLPLGMFSEEILKNIQVGTAFFAQGLLQASLGKGQTMEVIAEKIEILGTSENYPIQPKKHSLEFLREVAHLRLRTQTFGAIFRIRHHLAQAVHRFFDEKGFFYIHTPIITAADAEGAGETFQVTTLNLEKLPKTKEGQVDFSQDFFGQTTHLTVSGQLEGELAAMGLGKIYTFGPTFRSENSNTTRHLSEFWMIEPEIAFADLNDNIILATDFLKFVCQQVLEKCKTDLTFLQEREQEEERNLPQNQRKSAPLLVRIEQIIQVDFERLTYTEAIELLKKSKKYKEKKFQFLPEWGQDLQSEHERYLAEEHFKKPVIITDYPAEFKAFYMRLNEDQKTVAAMDILFPGIGEMVGGSQREERLEVLLEKCKTMHIHIETIDWYLDTRRYGSCVHSGFGVGFERLMMFLTGMNNIRDVIPFPRTPKNVKF